MLKGRGLMRPRSVAVSLMVMVMVMVMVILFFVIQTHRGNGASSSMMEKRVCLEERRVLQKKRYISYETLRRDMVPCGRAGAPYYNCHVGPVNPYSRGCEVITACRGTIKGFND